MPLPELLASYEQANYEITEEELIEQIELIEKLSVDPQERLLLNEDDLVRKVYLLKKALLGRYIHSQIYPQFKLLSEDIFKLERVLKINFEKNTIVSFEDYFDTDLTEDTNTRYLTTSLLSLISVDSTNFYLGSVKNPGRKTVYTHFRTELPSLPKLNNYLLQFKFSQKLFQCLSKIYSNTKLAVFFNEVITGRHSFWNSNPTVSFYYAWIANIKDIYFETYAPPTNKDPALIAKIGDSYFLVSTWEEAPTSQLETLLKEFGN